jgi:hypothetical protein
MSVLESAANPFRPVDWRWRRALSIIEGRGPIATRRRDTPAGFKWIHHAARFLREQQHASRNEYEMAVLAEKRPELYWAHWLWANGRSQKSSVEAHLLARENNFEIGHRCGILPGVIEAYESLFFNVREKLSHPNYVLHCVLGEAVHRGYSSGDFDLVWKMYGFFLGPHVLSAIESGFSGANWASTPDSVGAAVQDDAISTLKLKSALAAKTIPINQHTQVAILELFCKFTEIERNSDTAGKAQDTLLEHIGAMMAALPLNVAGTNPATGRKLLPGPLAAYDAGSVELNYGEVMRVGVGHMIEDAESLQNMTFADAAAG